MWDIGCKAWIGPGLDLGSNLGWKFGFIEICFSLTLNLGLVVKSLSEFETLGLSGMSWIKNRLVDGLKDLG